jgi:hypothetical protein
MLATLDNTEPAAASVFEFNLNRIKFESASEASKLIRGAFGESFDSGQGEVSFFIGSGAVVHAKMELLAGVPCPDICVNPVTCLNISLRMGA